MSPPPRPAGPTPSEALLAELASFPPGSLTVRLISALLKVLPNAPAFPAYTSIEAAAAAVYPGLPPEVVTRAAELADEPALGEALRLARTVDTSDTGLSVVSGVRSALSLFLGSSPADASLDQQRADAGLKALALAYLITRVAPGTPPERLQRVLAIPAGRELLLYYATIEVALPFHRELLAEPERALVREICDRQSTSLLNQLLRLVGRDGLAEAQALLPLLTGPLDERVRFVLPHTQALAHNVQAVLPAAGAPVGQSLPALVAAGADALPCYRYLVARLAIESRLALAQRELLPEQALSESLLPPEPSGEAAAPSDATEPVPTPVPDALTASASAPDARPEPPLVAVPASPPRPSPPESPAPLPPEQRIVGVFTSRGAEDHWLVFTREGYFSGWPAARPPPVDWEEHARHGHLVARYRRLGEDQVQIDWPDGRSTQSRLALSTYRLTLDGQECLRADFNLEGQVLEGRWRARGGGPTLTLFGDGNFAVNAGDSALPTGAGRYALGAAAIALSWEDEATRVYTFYTTLLPDRRAPARLLFGGRRFDRL